MILTDPVEDDKGDDERLAFVFDRSRLEVSGLACELVVPYSWSKSNRPKTGIAAIALDRQFARTPYAVSFKRRDGDLHPRHPPRLLGQQVGPGCRRAGTRAELHRHLAQGLGPRPRQLGPEPDLPRRLQHRPPRQPLWQAFTSTGLTVPEQIDRPRLIAGKPLDHYYDQIAWFTADDAGTKPLLSLRYTEQAGTACGRAGGGFVSFCP